MHKSLDKLNNEKKKRMEKLKNVEKQIKCTPDKTRSKKLSKEAKKLKTLIGRYPSREEKLKQAGQGKREKLSVEINNFEYEIKEFSDKLMTLVKDESRIERFIEGEYVIPDVAAKIILPL